MIYLDFNATTPLASQAKAAITHAMELYGNPSSGHALGRAAKENYETARGHIASLVNAQVDEMTILSCGTESINYCLRGAAIAAKEAGLGNHLITSSVEHDAVLEVIKFLVEEHGFDATFLPVDEFGQVSVKSVVSAVTPATVLVSIMHSNNEVGTINPIAEIAAALKASRSEGSAPILFHSDTSQSLGKVKVDVEELGVDYLTVTGHKLYAPKGIGALYSRRGTPSLRKLMFGAGHEGGKRAGTENTLLAAGLGAACALAQESLPETEAHLRTLRDRLQSNLEKRFVAPSSSSKVEGSGGGGGDVDDVMRVNGHPTSRLPNTLSVSFKNVLAPQILATIESKVLCSAGAACHSHEDERVSHVLKAMRVPLEFARGTLRLSVGKTTTEEEVDEAAQVVGDAVESLLRPTKGPEGASEEAGQKRMKTTT